MIEKANTLAGVSASQLRADLKVIYDARPTELCGVWRVACRHCHGLNGQFQYTKAEMYYIEQAHSYGEQEWPTACITKEFGYEMFSHAHSAYVAGKNGVEIDIKGGDGYSRNLPINKDCVQCDGRGVPFVWIADTRKISAGAKQLFKGVKCNGDKIELVTIDKTHVLDILARDTKVGVERRELSIVLPRTPEEFESALSKMSSDDLEQFVTNMVTLKEGEYDLVDNEVIQVEPPKKIGYVRTPKKIGFVRTT
jgi:hypothetical protein